MPTPAYISIHGKTQGHITKGAFTADSVGNVYVEGHEDEILAQEIDHQIAAPTDPGARIDDRWNFAGMCEPHCMKVRIAVGAV